MRVSDLMSTDVITVGREASLKEAARHMIEAGVSGLVVTGAEGDVEGVITEADFVKAEAGRRTNKRAGLLRWFSHEDEMPSAERRVGDVMTTHVLTAGPDADHAEVARLMEKEGVKRVPIVDGGHLIGIISRGDIMRAFARPDADIISEVQGHLLPKVLWIDPRRVSVESVEGNVTLAGHLETRSDATVLEAMIKRLDGVVSVDSQLTWEIDNTKLQMVSPPPGQARRPEW